MLEFEDTAKEFSQSDSPVSKPRSWPLGAVGGVEMLPFLARAGFWEPPGCLGPGLVLPAPASPSFVLHPFLQDVATMQFCANKLDKKDFFGKSDPFLVFYRSNEDGT